MIETASATWARVALSAGSDRLIMAGTSCDRSAALSCSDTGVSVLLWNQRRTVNVQDRPERARMTFFIPSGLRHILQVDASGEARRPIDGKCQDELKEMAQEARLDAELLQVAFGLFTRSRLQRCKQKFWQVGHRRSCE